MFCFDFCWFCFVLSKAFDENIFNEYPNIKRWIGHCKTKITNYDELNQAGADIFGRLAKTQLAKLDQN